ncbi:MAG TPA: enoyl-CoA hydratase-related protein [Acidimicrobiia bacterium]|jgi:2-(1,2-epoxy-1,2-dihydrophenyl)acetyl-CoA isomerase
MGTGIRVVNQGAVSTVVLDRPEVMNRFEGTMREGLLAALEVAATDAAVRCVMITGAGSAFSAGADIEELVRLHEAEGRDEIRRRVEVGAEIVRLIRAMAKPVVAAVDGNAAGAGVNLALACDLRVGSERAVFTESFVRIGLIPDWGGFHSLVRLVGAGRAADMMMTGTRVDAVTAYSLGILQRVFPTATFRADALDYATRLADGPPRALAAIKEGLRIAENDAIERVFAHERMVQPALFSEADCLAGLRAFLEKRPPEFRGSR